MMRIRSLLIVLTLTMPVAGCGVRAAAPQATPRPAAVTAAPLSNPSPILRATVPAPTPVQATPQDESASISMATQVIDLINTERTAASCPPLIVDRTLAAVAVAHSTTMAQDDFFDHTDPAGHSPFDRLSAAGYRYRLAAENIAAGPTTADAVVAGWLASPGHRANILNCDLQVTGVGYVTDPQDALGYGTYWTQLFATPP